MGSSKKRSNRRSYQAGNPKFKDKRDRASSKCNEREDVKDTYQNKGYNDVSWYTRYPNLIIGAGQVGYPYRPGMEIPILNGGTTTKRMSIPGVLAINWVPSFGSSSGPNDPASRVAQEMYTRVRAVYSGGLEADGPDFLMYVGALDSIYTYIGWLKKVYRIVSTYSDENFALPNALMAATGLGKAAGSGTNTLKVFEDIRHHKDRLWTLTNELIHMVRKFKCPAVMDVFNRHYWMSDNVFADANSPRAQLYSFNLIGVYKLAQLPIVGDDSGNTAAGLQMKVIPSKKATDDDSIVDTLFNFGQSLVAALDSWDSGYTISGYLQKAFDGVPNFAVAELQQGEFITATYSEEVLSQIENLVPAVQVAQPGSSFSSMVVNMTVQQDVIHNSIVTNNRMEYVTTGLVAEANAWNNIDGNLSNLINVRTDNPSVGDTVIATRLMCIPNFSMSYDATSKNVTVTADPISGTEIVVQCELCELNPSGTPTVQSVPRVAFIPQNAPISNEMGLVLSTMMKMEQFDWHPFQIVIQNTLGNLRYTNPQLLGDVHNITTITDEQLLLLNRYCLYSEFNAFNIA